MRCIWNRILPYYIVCEKQKMMFRIHSIKKTVCKKYLHDPLLLRCIFGGYFTVPWGHRRGFMHCSEKKERKKERKWCDMQRSRVTHARNLCSAFYPYIVHTHSSEHTPEQWAAIYAAAPGEQLGVRCLAQGHLVMVLRVERALYIHSPHLQFLQARDRNRHL